MEARHANRRQGEPVIAHDIVTAAELATEYRVSAATVKRWALAGRVPSIKPTPRTLRFSRRAVAEKFGLSVTNDKE